MCCCPAVGFGADRTQQTTRDIRLILLMDKILHQLIGSLSHYLQGYIHPRWCRIWMFPKNRGVSPKMDGENNGKSLLKMDDLGGKPTIFGNIHIRLMGNCNLPTWFVYILFGKFGDQSYTRDLHKNCTDHI